MYRKARIGLNVPHSKSPGVPIFSLEGQRSELGLGLRLELPSIGGTLKMTDMKLTDMKMTDMKMQDMFQVSE